LPLTPQLALQVPAYHLGILTCAVTAVEVGELAFYRVALESVATQSRLDGVHGRLPISDQDGSIQVEKGDVALDECPLVPRTSRAASILPERR
jgi:hypothetical protein